MANVTKKFPPSSLAVKELPTDTDSLACSFLLSDTPSQPVLSRTLVEKSRHDVISPRTDPDLPLLAGPDGRSNS